MRPCPSTFSDMSCPSRPPRGTLRSKGVELLGRHQLDTYIFIYLLVALGEDPLEVKRFFGLKIGGSMHKVVTSFYEYHRKALGEATTEGILMELYKAVDADCVCARGPLVPLGVDEYVVQRPTGIYHCVGGSCDLIGESPLRVYEHPEGCILEDQQLPLPAMGRDAVIKYLQQKGIKNTDMVSDMLLPALCRDLWEVEIGIP